MDLKKFQIFSGGDPESQEIRKLQEEYDKEVERKSKEMQANKSLMIQMVQSRGWKLLEEEQDARKQSLLNKMYKAARERNFDQVAQIADEISAINELYRTIINIVGPQK